jgi:LPXTG-motif cell wall-anchored protein
MECGADHARSRFEQRLSDLKGNDMETILIVLLVLFLLGGGGFWYRRRRI